MRIASLATPNLLCTISLDKFEVVNCSSTSKTDLLNAVIWVVVDYQFPTATCVRITMFSKGLDLIISHVFVSDLNVIDIYTTTNSDLMGVPVIVLGSIIKMLITSTASVGLHLAI